MPQGVTDRPAEVWEALLAVADAAGGPWPKRARDACSYFVLNNDPGKVSLGVRLLGDIRTIFTKRNVTQLPTAELVTALVDLDESPWADLYGKPLDARRLARELDRYGVRPVQYKQDGEKQRGYVTHPTDNPVQSGLADAWGRYLESAGTGGTRGTDQVNPVPDENPVPDGPGTGTRPGTALTREVPQVPAVPRESRPPEGAA
jgi:hypothetical protein